MKTVALKSVFDAFDYVMAHYYPFGMEDYAELTDTYAVISIQDTHTDGFGFIFRPNEFCQAVLTLYFDDIVKEMEGAFLFTDEQAEQIIDFILANREAETLLVHCYGGQSRSRAVAAFAVKMLGGDNAKYFETGNPNSYVYEMLEQVWERRQQQNRNSISKS